MKKRKKKQSKLRNSTQPLSVAGLVGGVTVPSTHPTPIMPAAEGVTEHNDQIRASILFNSNTPQIQRVEERMSSNNMPSNHTKKKPSKFSWFMIRFALCLPCVLQWANGLHSQDGGGVWSTTTASSKTLYL
jgi:hypothetical protein